MIVTRSTGPGRGFTVLETVMAAVIGSMVVLVCVSMFSTLEASNVRMERRFRHSADLARTRVVVARLLDSLLMSTEPQSTAGANRESSRPLPPARFSLKPDESALIQRQVRLAQIAGAGAGGAEILSPQRFEMVTARAPVPPGFVSALDPTVAQASEQAEAERSAPGSASWPMAAPMRSVLELRPDGATRRAPGARVEDEGGWTLWWRPLPLPEAANGFDPRGVDPTDDVSAVPLISGLTSCSWTVFRDRERMKEAEGIWAVDLPAYVELELSTGSGLSVNWMFEVGWGNGQEIVAGTATEPDGGASDGGSGRLRATPVREGRPGR